MDEDISGKHQPADRTAELMRTAIALVAHHPRAAADWYARLTPNELQLVSAGFHDMLISINIAITTLREYIQEAPPELVSAMEKLEPLLDIPGAKK